MSNQALNPLPALLDAHAADGRIDLVCIRPLGPFTAFDDRLTRIALRWVRKVHVTIIRTWDCAAQNEWLGFVSAAVPTVLLIRAGRVIAKCVGDLPYLELEQVVSGATH
jgi:hypothetical protein